MKFKEFGDIKSPTIILLHEGGLSWWSLAGTIELLKKDYHIVAPTIDGHGEDALTTFVSIKDSADKLIRYIDEHNGGNVFALGGSTLGAQIVVEALSQRADIANYAIIESPWVVPSKSMTFLSALTGKLLYSLNHRKWYARIRARELCINKNQVIQFYKDISSMTRETLVNISTNHAGYAVSDSLKNTNATLLIILGSKEIKKMDASIHKLIDMVPKTKVFIVPGMKQGEFSLIHSTEYYYLFRHITE
jgi:pimeloyl-ACP methyl ester carboxylesterase